MSNGKPNDAALAGHPAGYRAFTLLELLIVVAVICIILGMVFTAVSMVRASAAKLACLNQQRQNVLAWLQFAQNNSRKMVSGSTDGWYGGSTSDWVKVKSGSPWNAILDASGQPDGALIPYYDRGKAILSCPAAAKSVRALRTVTYSISDSMNGSSHRLIGDVAQVKRAANQMVFSEEPQVGNGFTTYEIGEIPLGRIYDPMAIWHRNGLNIAYADGHAAWYGYRNTLSGLAYEYNDVVSGSSVDIDFIRYANRQQGLP